MKYYSTRDRKKRVPFQEAVMKSLSSDGGLYMPVSVPVLPLGFLRDFKNLSFNEIAKYITRRWIDESEVSDLVLNELIDKAFDFPAPLKGIHNNIYSLELFHGPSMAFKDFGARFMAQFMGHFNQRTGRTLNILVATSGDTGGAVASGFYQVSGVEVVIFFPKGKVSKVQEKQLTTWGQNITAVEVEGSFDDCQAIVKQAFLDDELAQTFQLGSANSINIARLLPQSFYYFEAIKQVSDKYKRTIISVPSGNFGNLTAGLFAKRMGLQIGHFIAATNANDVVPDYLESGKYEARTSIPTISNAMDVGNPSNFERIMDIYGSSWNHVAGDIKGFSLNDIETKRTMMTVYKQHDYILDPHGAVAYASIVEQAANDLHNCYVFLETAHPGKFRPTVEEAIATPLTLPQDLENVLDKVGESVPMLGSYDQVKPWLVETLKK